MVVSEYALLDRAIQLRTGQRTRGSARVRANTPLLESVALTPEGRRREHTLQLTSPAGTTRTSAYISPTNADFSPCEPGDEYLLDEERECELRMRRSAALEAVAGQQSGKQRSALFRARSKRSASEVQAAPQSKRMCDRLDAPTLNRMAHALFRCASILASTLELDAN